MEMPRRKVNRLKGFDYSQKGGYFITICVKNKDNILWSKSGGSGTLTHDKPVLSNIGSVVDMAINNIPHFYNGASVDKYVIMPNHVHMILLLQDNVMISSSSISTIIGHLKRYTTKQVGYPIWQKSFYDRVIRNESDYKSYWQYVDENPLKWRDDEYFI